MWRRSVAAGLCMALFSAGGDLLAEDSQVELENLHSARTNVRGCDEEAAARARLERARRGLLAARMVDELPFHMREVVEAKRDLVLAEQRLEAGWRQLEQASTALLPREALQDPEAPLPFIPRQMLIPEIQTVPVPAPQRIREPLHEPALPSRSAARPQFRAERYQAELVEYAPRPQREALRDYAPRSRDPRATDANQKLVDVVRRPRGDFVRSQAVELLIDDMKFGLGVKPLEVGSSRTCDGLLRAVRLAKIETPEGGPIDPEQRAAFESVFDAGVKAALKKTPAAGPSEGPSAIPPAWTGADSAATDWQTLAAALHIAFGKPTRTYDPVDSDHLRAVCEQVESGLRDLTREMERYAPARAAPPAIVPTLGAAPPSVQRPETGARSIGEASGG